MPREEIGNKLISTENTTTDFSLKSGNNFLVKSVWIITYFVCWLIIKVIKRMNISVDKTIYQYNKKQPLIIISNHKSVFDPWIISESIPFKTFLKILPIRILGATNFKDSFSVWLDKLGIIKIVYRLYGVVPFRTEWLFKEKLAPLIDCLKKGETVMIFPEGHLNREEGIGQFKRGIVYMYNAVDSEILPIAVNPGGQEEKKWSVKVGQICKIPRQIIDSEISQDPFLNKSCDYLRQKVLLLYNQK